MNDYKWRIVTVLGSAPRKLLGDKKELIILYTGDEDQRIDCTVTEAIPLPTFRWEKFELVRKQTGTWEIKEIWSLFEYMTYQDITNSSSYKIKTLGMKSSLTFAAVKHEHEGEYHCYASNFRRIARKEFIVRTKGAWPQNTPLWGSAKVSYCFIALSWNLQPFWFSSHQYNKLTSRFLWVTA